MYEIEVNFFRCVCVCVCVRSHAHAQMCVPKDICAQKVVMNNDFQNMLRASFSHY